MRRPFADVYFESGWAARGVEAVEIHTGEFQHEIAVLTVEESSYSKRFQTGAPVRVDWGYTPTAVRTFYGYVNHAEPVGQPEADLRGDRHMRVFCVSPTWVFKDSELRTFRGMSATAVIKRLAEEHRFDTRHLHGHSKVWPVHHQGEKSDWEFMVACAERIGWTLFARGLELHCIDRKKAVEQSRTMAPILRPAIEGGGHIRKMRSNLGSTAPQGGDLRVRDAYGVNPRNERVLARRNGGNTDRPMFRATPVAPRLTQAVTDVVFESLDEASTKLGAREALNRMPIEATLTAAMSPRAMVGNAVYVQGMAEPENGHWYVREAIYKIRPYENEMRLTIGRDTVSPQTALVPTGGTPPVPRPARLVNRKWVLG